jgi:hypothetical protein
MAEDPDLTPAQRGGLERHEANQDRTLAAMHHLEAALGAASPGRETAWRDDVLGALAVLEAVTTEEYDNAERPDSLLSDIKRNQPRLRNRARGLRLQYAHLRDAIVALRRELDVPETTVTDVADMRERLAWLLTAMRHQRARESDLIYEAYFDAFDADLAPDPGTDRP